MDNLTTTLHNAVWNREIDQMSTREVADKYASGNISRTRKILMNILLGLSGDDRFQPNTERGEGVLVKDGYTFNFAPMDMDGGGMSNNAPKHYIWFCD